MENEIVLLKNNDEKTQDDIEWINEFYYFLHELKLTSSKAFSIIHYLQEHLPILPDHIEQCSICKDLYDSHCSGYYSELKSKFYCNNCFPPFLEEREEKILQRRSRKAESKSKIK